MAESAIIISASQITQWRADKEALEREIAERQQKVALLAKKLDAAAILAETTTPLRDAPLFSSDRQAPPPDESGANMTEAIERIANAAPAPITKKELKRQLAALGFPQERLSGYFYTPVMRLKEKRRISVLEDGKIWRAPT